MPPLIIGRILLILTGTTSTHGTTLDPPHRRRLVLSCPNEARGDFYRVSWLGCRETDAPVIVAEARRGEFGSAASGRMVRFPPPGIRKKTRYRKNRNCSLKIVSCLRSTRKFRNQDQHLNKRTYKPITLH